METMQNHNNRFRFPFTSLQWQELEHQALVYKYMISGMPIPPDLLFSIKTSLDPSTKLILHHHSPHQTMGWDYFQMGFGRKIDPEPGRCRRTDGKKWRCSKEAYPHSKYCERHMHRGRNRSRKPVEVNLSTPTKSPNYPCNSSGGFQLSSSSSPSWCSRGPVLSSQSQDRFLLESSPYYSHMNSEKEQRYGMKESETISDSWQLNPLTMNNSSSSSLNQSKESNFSDHQNLQFLNQDQEHCYDHLRLKTERKDEPQKIMHCFFDESPNNLNDNEDHNKDFSSTQLSISIPNCARDFFLAHNDK